MSSIHLVGERERANLVVYTTGAIFLYIYGRPGGRAGAAHTVYF